MKYDKPAAVMVSFALLLPVPLAESSQSLKNARTFVKGTVNEQIPPKQEVSAQRYAVYSTAIAHLYDKVYGERGVELIVISDQTEDQQRLKPEFTLTTNYALASKSDLDALLYNQDKNAFFNRYETAPGYMVLSPISFNADESQAKLSIGLECGFLCGIGWYFRLSKSGLTWSVEEHKVTWQK